jgi:hypothetical protein
MLSIPIQSNPIQWNLYSLHYYAISTKRCPYQISSVDLVYSLIVFTAHFHNTQWALKKVYIDFISVVYSGNIIP